MALVYCRILSTADEFVQKILELQNGIEPAARAENEAATRIQSAWRRHKTWRLILHWQNAARTIHRFWKGFLARRQVRKIRARNEELKLLAAINHSATVIQAAWRGYQTRTAELDFDQRRKKLQLISAANENIQKRIQAALEKDQKDVLESLQNEMLFRAERNLEKMHCQISTRAHPGVHAKNQRLEAAIKEQCRRTLHHDPKTLEALRPPPVPEFVPRTKTDH